MKIHIESIGFLELKDILGKGDEIEFDGVLFSDLLTSILEKYGDPIAKVLVDRHGGLKPGIQIFINRKIKIPIKSVYQEKLRDGDNILFMLLMGGG